MEIEVHIPIDRFTEFLNSDQCASIIHTETLLDDMHSRYMRLCTSELSVADSLTEYDPYIQLPSITEVPYTVRTRVGKVKCDGTPTQAADLASQLGINVTTITTANGYLFYPLGVSAKDTQIAMADRISGHQKILQKFKQNLIKQSYADILALRDTFFAQMTEACTIYNIPETLFACHSYTSYDHKVTHTSKATLLGSLNDTGVMLFGDCIEMDYLLRYHYAGPVIIRHNVDCRITGLRSHLYPSSSKLTGHQLFNITAYATAGTFIDSRYERHPSIEVAKAARAAAAHFEGYEVGDINCTQQPE